MSYTPISALPDAPSRTEPSTFSTKADAFVAALAGFVTQTNAAGTYINGVGTQVDLDATAAAASAASAEASETIALAAANFKGNWSSLTGALNIPASVFHDDAYWMLVSNLANVTTKEPGVDPEWELIFSQDTGATATEFTSSGTYTVPSKASWLYVEILGSGGGGSGGDTNGSSAHAGGSGGAFVREFIPISRLPSGSLSVTVGAGGSGGAGDTAGAAGGSSSVSGDGVSFTAFGGNGGDRTNEAQGGYAYLTGSFGIAQPANQFPYASASSSIGNFFSGGRSAPGNGNRGRSSYFGGGAGGISSSPGGKRFTTNFNDSGTGTDGTDSATAPTNGANGTNIGDGGGGGGNNTGTGNGGNGGNGATAAGGGAGGCAVSGTGGTGGNGGDGLVLIWAF